MGTDTTGIVVWETSGLGRLVVWSGRLVVWKTSGLGRLVVWSGRLVVWKTSGLVWETSGLETSSLSSDDDPVGQQFLHYTNVCIFSYLDN